MPDHVPDIEMMRRNVRYGWAAMVFFSAGALFLGGFLIPFTFESPSMFYKLGVDKFLLRTGKVIGITAALLFLFQLPLAGRLKPLDRLFFMPVLYRVHRMDGWIIGLMALVHPACVLLPDDRITIPLETRYWPEWVGAVLLILILTQVILAFRRHSFSIPYSRWRELHRWVGAAAAIALGVHVLFVSETFNRSGIPRTAVFILAGTWLLLWLWIRTQSARRFLHRYRVTGIAAAGKDAYAVDLAPAAARPFPYAPGQFAFFSFFSPCLSPEAHPFTLSSSPTRPDHLQVVVRCVGDWTGRIGFIRERDTAFIQGPFGGFTHLLLPSRREIVMIAGGIGITPMWSMLRYIHDTKDPRRVLLLWSNRSEAHLFGREELIRMQRDLTQFSWIPIFTRENPGFGRFGRLDRGMLQDLLKQIHRNAAVFVCGPPEMIHHIRNTLRQLGFSRSCIRHEMFGL